MELWIRSQDRTLLTKANSLYVHQNTIWFEVPFYENHKVIGLSITGHNHRIATYKTEERALEVLDEIQEFIENRNKIKITQDINGITSEVEDAKRVYEMPSN